MEIVEFLTACLDEDERVALAATQHRWIVSERKTPASADSPSGDPFWVAADEGFGAPAFQFKDKRDAEFIAAHGPARVLREIDAKRDLLRFAEGIHDHHETFTTGVAARLEQTLRLFALAYADRPGFREEWAL